MARNSLSAMNVVPKGKGAKGSTFQGMPGYICTNAKAARSTLVSSKSAGPHAEGSFGKKGPSNNEGKIYGRAANLTDNYRADSTGKPGHYEATRPAGHLPSATQKISGHPGRMESMSGRGVTKAEGRRKSRMY